MIKIKGVAIDIHNNSVAAGVYVKTDNQLFKAKYGLPDNEIVRRTKKQKYLKSGFILTIPMNKLK